jgi:signal transduction histidine kinase
VGHLRSRTGFGLLLNFHSGTMFDPSSMNDSERLSRLRHDLSNPLSALLAETQLLLLNESQIDPETVTGLREIEALAIRMRTMLREI